MTNQAALNRHTGLIIIEVSMSNPNGDPDMESEPRVRTLDNLGMISPVSIKRKYRDLLGFPIPQEESKSDFLKNGWEWKKSLYFQEAIKKLNLSDSHEYEILETRHRNRDQIMSISKEDFKKKFWDARLFGNTFLESTKSEDEKSSKQDKKNKDKEIKAKKEKGDYEHLINTGALQIGVGLSVAPIDIVERMTLTNKSGVEGDKDRGMAPLALRVVPHGIYYIPFHFNPSVAMKTGATQEDLNLFKFLTPYIYSGNTSMTRSDISVLHAWCVEHNNPLGSIPDYQIIDALKPKLKNKEKAAASREEYEIPLKASLGQLENRFKKVWDLTDGDWLEEFVK